MVLGPEIRDMRLDKGEIKPPHTSTDSVDNGFDWSVPGLDADLIDPARSRFNIIDIRSRSGNLGVEVVKDRVDVRLKHLSMVDIGWIAENRM